MTVDRRLQLDGEFLEALERELLDARSQLVRLADRTDALAALWEMASRLQDEQRYPIGLGDVQTAAAVKGEQARAELQSVLERILGPDE